MFVPKHVAEKTSLLHYRMQTGNDKNDSYKQLMLMIIHDKWPDQYTMSSKRII